MSCTIHVSRGIRQSCLSQREESLTAATGNLHSCCPTRTLGAGGALTHSIRPQAALGAELSGTCPAWYWCWSEGTQQRSGELCCRGSVATARGTPTPQWTCYGFTPKTEQLLAYMM